MIAPGTDLKYRLSVELDGFTLDHDDFSLTIRNRYGQPRYVIGKRDFLRDTDGRWYFVMPEVRNGSYYATLTCHLRDTDFADGTQGVTDMRHLVDVGVCPCEPRSCRCAGTDGMAVRYERVMATNCNSRVHEWTFGCAFPIILT